jgi:hypothetical protein
VQFYWLILGVLAVWRISYLLTSESGPSNVLSRLRHGLGSGLIGQLFSCLYCMSLWISAPFAFFLGESWTQRFLLWPALSAGAIIIERCIHREPTAPLYCEDREHAQTEYQIAQEADDVLRQEQ